MLARDGARRHAPARIRSLAKGPVAGFAVGMDLVEVCFQGSGKTVFVPPGTTLLAAAGMAGIDVATGCTRGMCGTDAWHVQGAADCLHVAVEPERATLDRMGVAADCRLLCSARVQRGRVVVAGDAVAG